MPVLPPCGEPPPPRPYLPGLVEPAPSSPGPRQNASGVTTPDRSAAAGLREPVPGPLGSRRRGPGNPARRAVRPDRGRPRPAQPCGDGEPYLPHAGRARCSGSPTWCCAAPTARRSPAPTAADLAGKGDGWYLDLPGQPAAPGCDYEEWFRAGRSGPAHRLRPRGDRPRPPGQGRPPVLVLVGLQRLERQARGRLGDGPGRSSTPTPPRRRCVRPPRASRSPSTRAPRRRRGTTARLLTRRTTTRSCTPAQGSHAAYYTQAQWFGKSAAAGFGCDNTTPRASRSGPTVGRAPPARRRRRGRSPG